ncbi:MAG: RHS repeat-associated core domain-containing protein [Thermoanaerobaculaceae bacterium]
MLPRRLSLSPAAVLALAVAAWALAAPAVASRGPVWAVSQSDPGFHTERPGVWDGDTLVAETGLNFQDAITWRRQHLPGPSGLDDAPLVRVEANLQGGGSPDPHLYAVVRDELGSVIGVLDQAPPAGAPALRARVLYTPYGEAHLETGPGPLRLWFDPTLTTAGGQTQQVAPPVPPATESGAIGGGLRLTTTARLDPASAAAGLGVERYDPASGSWVAVAASEVAAGPSASEETELDLVLLAGWPKGGQIRVTLRPALADGFGRAFQVPAGEDPAGVRVVVTVPASGGAPELDRRWPLRFDSGFAAANSLGGAFPDGQTSLYQGLWTDPVTGIAYARARWYDARTASWLSEDPVGTFDSPNLYAFVAHQPHMATDPTGEFGYLESPWDVASLAVGTASLCYNAQQGNVGAFTLDLFGVVVDAAAVMLPVPGGAGMAIKAGRAGTALGTARRVVEAGQVANQAINVAQAGIGAQEAFSSGHYGWGAFNLAMGGLGIRQLHANPWKIRPDLSSANMGLGGVRIQYAGGPKSAAGRAATQRWSRSQGEWVTGRVNRAGQRLQDLFEYRFPHSASRQGMGFAEQGHHVWPEWLGGPRTGPRLPTRQGLHFGAETGIHQGMNRWLVERGVIPAERIYDAAWVQRALEQGVLSKSTLKRELYLFYRTKYPNMPGIPRMLQEAFR